MSLIPPERILHAAAVVLVRERDGQREIFWVQRSREVSLGGGFFAFPGGRIDASDKEVANKAGLDGIDGALLVAGARELFEEAGVLLVRRSVPADSLAEARRDLLAEKRSFAQVLADLGVELDPSALSFAGRWLTPPFIRTRFDTRFYLAAVPAGQTAEVWPGELTRGEWITPADALDRWRAGRALLHPPATHILSCLIKAPPPACLDRMRSPPHVLDYVAERIEFQAGILLVPVLTPTLPPATHTNCYIIGEQELVVIDPASPYPDDQKRLATICDSLIAEGRRFREILLTHDHHDHIGGVEALRRHLGIPVRAHEVSAARMKADGIDVDGTIAADEVIRLPGSLGLRLRAMFTPGHHPGHLCYFEETTGALIAGDMVAGIGSIVVDPSEGDMADYVQSLKTLRTMPVNALYPAHGPTIPDGPRKLDEYIAHRAEREQQVVTALQKAGGGTALELVPHVYTEVDPSVHWLAARSLTAVLAKLVKEGRAVADAQERYELR